MLKLRIKQARDSWKNIPIKIHTNFNNEITGAYYEEKSNIAITIIEVAFAVIIAISLIDLMLPEFVTGAGVWLLELVN